MTPEIITLQQTIVELCMAAEESVGNTSRPCTWDTLAVHVSAAEPHGRPQLQFAFLPYLNAVKDSNKLPRHVPYERDQEFRDTIWRLRTKMAEQSGKKAWGTCIIEVNNQGEYRFQFGYERPDWMFDGPGFVDAEVARSRFVSEYPCPVFE